MILFDLFLSAEIHVSVFDIQYFHRFNHSHIKVLLFDSKLSYVHCIKIRFELHFTLKKQLTYKYNNNNKVNAFLKILLLIVIIH